MVYIALLLALSMASQFSRISLAQNPRKGDISETKFYGSFECGYTNNRALYATFGYERQLWTCSQAILGVEGEYRWADNQNGYMIFKFEFAPLYNSIKTINGRKTDMVSLPEAEVEKYRKNGIVVPDTGIHRLTYELIRSPLGNGRILEIDGSSEYVNWYKNQGNRLYYLEDHPIREMYIGFFSENRKHKISVGRMKNLLSFDEQDMIWHEDAWFAPMSYWISREIYSGIKYSFKTNFGPVLEIAIFSGDGNPTKNGIYYIDNSGSPNKKSNNTPTIELNLGSSLNYGNLDSSVFFGLERGTIGSVWDVAIEEGKHNKNIVAAGFDTKYHLNGSILDKVRLYFQYTKFTSGLKSASSQNKGHPAFRDIVQDGFFVGLDFTLGRDLFGQAKLGFTWELFSRYDYRAHVYSLGNAYENEGREGKECLKEYVNSKQRSFIVNAKFSVNKNIFLNLAAHFLYDPLYWISDVLKNHGNNRYKLSLEVKF
ncbi:MAG: hypothetical protein LBI70_00145 [Rickettsiales bacterium]|jgi:hypothetical protein|nr:hypothetical protein [Rickettsiales bacterium]